MNANDHSGPDGTASFSAPAGENTNDDTGPGTSSGADGGTSGERSGSVVAEAASEVGLGGARDRGLVPRRRRGSRGGRRRRGRKSGGAAAGSPGSGDSDATEAEDLAPDEREVGAARRVRRLAPVRASGAEPPDSDGLESGPDPDPDELHAPEGEPRAGDGPRSAKRSGRRRSRRRKGGSGAEPPESRPAEVRAATPARQADRPEHEDEAEEGAPSEERRPRRRRGRRKKQAPAAGAAPQGGTRPTRSAPRGVQVELIPGEEDDLPELPELPDEAVVVDGEPEDGARSAGRKSRKRSRKKKRGEAAVDSDDDLDAEPAKEIPRTAQILVNASDREEMRVAVVRDGKIADFQMTVESEDSLVSDIYRGRVVNIEPSIGAAFVDFGRGRNGFLHTSDVLPAYGDEEWNLSKLLSTNVAADESGASVVDDELADDEADGEEEHAAASNGSAQKGAGDKRKGEGAEGRGGRRGRAPRFRSRPRLPITDLLEVGDRVAVQVTKDAIGDKGPTLTTYLSIPGRYLVLMPSITHTGVSRKIDDLKERKRLKRILDSLSIPKGMGVIARTAAAGHTKSELKRDVDYLLGAWERFSKELNEGRGTRTLYQESDVAIRTVRDLFGPDTESVVVDDEKVFHSIVEFTKRLMPEHVHRIRMHEGPRPLFHAHGVEQDFERIFSRRIELPSGGSIVFDQAEALVAIDVNSGKTRSDGYDFEEIALKTNLEAVPEIARQIRLRDLGGILVVDFIDMTKRSNMARVERAFREELAKDRARSKVGRISQFGLLEMTRQRLGPGMDKKVFHSCPRCRGQGRVRTVESRAAAILRRLGSALTLKGFSTVEVRAHPEVVSFLERSAGSSLDGLRAQHHREIRLVAAPEQLEDSVIRYLRTDGREVRPGGRRKR